VQRMHDQLRIAKPVPELVDLGLIVVVQMLPGAKDLNAPKARAANALEPGRGEPLVDKKMSRENVLHYEANLIPGNFAVEA
jgi:hypothetical protein